MKRSAAPLAIFALVGAGVLAVAACRPPRDRSDWRAPVTARPCKSDSDCPSGITCAIELGASQGTCDDPDGGARPYPYDYGPNAPDPHGDGGRPGPPRPQGPPINVQPQPGDINI